MKKILMIMVCAALLLGFSASSAEDPPVLEIRDYGDLTLIASWTVTHWSEVWDLTKGDLTLSYTIDMTGLNQPGTWNTFQSWQTWYTEVGLRGEDAGDFNPGPFGIYQGRCGGWMVSDSDVWTDSDGLTEMGVPKDSTQDLDDKHALQASGGRGEGDYDVLLDSPDTVLDPPIGSFNNHGIWFDRDGVDQWQANMWGNLGPGGVGSGDGLRYNTGGIYDIVITYHAIDDGLGVMFATVNGYQQGFYTIWVNGPPQDYPAGLSFKGDMKHMQVFAGLWSPSAPTGHDYGSAMLSDITVTGYLGTSDPLIADFNYSPATFYPLEDVQFTDASGGGMPPYTYEWDFGDSTNSTDQNPTHTYTTAGAYNVTLTVTPYRCVPKTITKMITVSAPGTGTPGYWMNHPDAWPAVEIIIGGVTYSIDEAIELMKRSNNKDVTYIMFQALVAAKLNVLIGNESSCIEATIADADAWMADYGPVGSGVKAGGDNSPWRTGESLYFMLDDYNNGQLCAPSRDSIGE
jgi:hypothetical protein